MATISVNINGNTGNGIGGSGSTNPIPPIPQGGNQQPQPLPPAPPLTPPAGRSNSLWSINSDQLVADMRREMQSRGVMLVPGTANYTQLLNQLKTQQQGRINSSIDAYFNAKYDDINADYETELSAVKDRINRQRNEQLQWPHIASDPYATAAVNDRFDRLLNSEARKLEQKYDPLYAGLRGEEDDAKKTAERELTKAIQELTEETKRGNRGGYINDLRERYKSVIAQREQATSKEEAQQYSKEAQRIQREIAEATGSTPQRNLWSNGIFGPLTPVMNIGTDWANKALQLYEMPYRNQMAHIQSLGQYANGDPFGAMLSENELKRSNYMTVGGIVGGVLGGILGAVAAPFTAGMSIPVGVALGGSVLGGIGTGLAGWLGSSQTKEGDVLAKLGQQYQQLEQRIKAFNDLTMITHPMGYEGDFEGGRDYLLGLLTNGWKNVDVGLTNRDLGMDAATFAQMVANRTKARGMWDGNLTDTYNRAFMSEGLERVFNLSSGSISQLSGFDRYGNDANQAITNLFTTLSNRGTIGMSDGHFLRSNEFLGYMQQMMQSQKGWMNPNANFAARQVATLQSMFGNNLDERAISEMNQINNAIINPGSGYASVITNNVIQDLFPETRGNLLAIREKQYSNDPKVREQIQKAMFQRLTSMYGGMDTTSGYLALAQYTGIQDPDRLRQWVAQMQRGYVSVDKGSQEAAIAELGTGYTPKLTQNIIEGQDAALQAINENSKRMGDMSEEIFKILNKNMQSIAEDLNKITGKIWFQ